MKLIRLSPPNWWHPDMQPAPWDDPLLRPVTESNYPPFPSFCIGNQLTAYELIMVCAGREPYAPWLGLDTGNIAPSKQRWDLMRAVAPQLARNLSDDIRADKIPGVIRSYRRNGELDIPNCVIGKEAAFGFVRRFEGYGRRIAEMLAEREQQENAAGAASALTSDDAANNELRPAPLNTISQAIRQAYDEAGEEQPNLNKIVKPVQAILQAKGLKASKNLIQKIAHKPEHKSRRRPVGKRRTAGNVDFPK